MKRVAMLAGVGACLALVAACGGGGGSNFPTGSATTTSSAQSSGGSGGGTTTSSSGSSGTTLASLDPCTLLTASDTGTLNLPSSGKPAQVGSSQTCEWQSSSYDVIVGTRTDGGLSALTSDQGPLTNTTVGSHSAVQQDTGSGSCGFYLGVTSSSRVDIQVTLSTSGSACTYARQVATAVEPKLPSS